jgi:nitronate monooxygenase/enoyl-[acyl-carrier protein] reductase II
VTTVEQAQLGAERGVDVIIAQGGEAGGYGGLISTLALVPQVVDAVAPIPVVAAGGIYDGRGMAAVLALGAVGVNLGTRFLASTEAPIEADWKQAVIGARSQDAIKAEALNAINPLPGTVGFGTVLRSLRTPFLEEWNPKLDEAREQREQLREAMVAATAAGHRSEYLLTAGQGAGGIDEVLPVAEIMRRIVAEAEEALRSASRLVR